MASSTEVAFRRLIKLYLFDRPEGEFSIHIRADLIAPDRHGWLEAVLVRMVADGEVVSVASGRPHEKHRVYRLAAGEWMKLLNEEPECAIRELKKLRLLPR